MLNTKHFIAKVHYLI